MIGDVDPAAATPWLVFAGGLAVAWITGRYQLRQAKESPATVADGYGKLVADMRTDIDRARRELDDVHHELVECQRGHAECARRNQLAEERIAALEAVIARPPT